MRATLVVSVPAGSTALTTIDNVKADLSITNSDEDAFIERAIARVSQDICNYLHIESGDDGLATLGRETIIETYRDEGLNSGSFHGGWIGGSAGASSEFLSLARRPVTTIVSVVEDDVTLDATDYEIDKQAGLLSRLFNDTKSGWVANKIVVTYTGGWLLPDDSGRNLPQPIEDAAIVLIKMARFAKARDPSLQSENILEGLYSYRLFGPADLESGMPLEARALLDPFRNTL